nr:polymer-forming cytoskeletal protein [Kiritimatiellia bacterium]
MKKLIGIITIALLAMVWTCRAVDYNNHFYNQRVYRVALGSGTAPSASELATVGLHNGDFVLNTDDDVLYIMHATNVYTKIASDGTLTLEALAIDGNAVVTGSITGQNVTAKDSLTVGTNATIGGNAVVTGAVTGQNVTAKNGLTVGTNATVGGTLGVTGVATFTATPVCRNGLTVQTNATIGGTLIVTGAITGPINAANLTAGTVASAISIANATNLPTSGLVLNANSKSLLDAADYAAMKVLLDLEIGSDVQAYDADLTTWAGITPSANAQALLLLTYAAMRTNLGLVVGTDVQAYD